MEDLLQEFEEWISFIGSLKAVNQEVWNSSIEQGKWTVKDIVCHIMLWDKYFYEEAIEKIAADKPLTVKHLNYDEFNRNAILYATTIPSDELFEQAVSYRKKIIDTIGSLPEVSIERNYVDGDGHVFCVPQYLRDFIWHDRHHMNPLKDYLALKQK
jgi:hypothetical protein